MATTRLNFGAEVDAWVLATKERAEAVFKESTKRTVSIAQAAVPVDTNFLRGSILASTSAMPMASVAKPKGGTTFAYNPGAVVAIIAGAKLGQTIFVGYTANYAKYVEYGTSRTPPRGFVARATQQWQSTVNTVTAEAKSRAAGR